MSEPTIEYFVTYEPNYPGLNDNEHAFFMNATTEGYSYSEDFIESHSSTNCVIDHASRISDYEITDEMKLKARRAIWSAMKQIEGKSI